LAAPWRRVSGDAPRGVSGAEAATAAAGEALRVERFHEVAISRAGLLKTGNPPQPNPRAKSATTPLLEELRTQILLRGPLPISTYMNECLTNPRHGYYTTRPVFGSRGDFVTSPDVSQMFGEIIGVWCVATWEQMGKPSLIRVVELGPGRGSLMRDLTRSAKQFPAFNAALRIHMVEVSPNMIELQKRAVKAAIDSVPPAESVAGGGYVIDRGTTVTGVPIEWLTSFSGVPADGPVLVVAHEFFDALPVAQLQYTERGWLEKMVDVDSGQGDHHLRFVLAPRATPAVDALLRFGKLAGADGAPPKFGDTVEVPLAAMATMERITQRVDAGGGAALVIDYGKETVFADSLQGIKNHQFVSPLSEPGLVDLSTHVSFSALKRVAHATSPRVRVYPLLDQNVFLAVMGIQVRAENLMRACVNDNERHVIAEGFNRLVDPAQMGTVYKVLCAAHEAVGAPPGFQHLPADPMPADIVERRAAQATRPRMVGGGGIEVVGGKQRESAQ
jgi:NADH dehydrogenase [ubiquinone] 1 alpha subcomplex assembly factor 7